MTLPPPSYSHYRVAGAGLLLFAAGFLLAATVAPAAVARSLPLLSSLGFNTALSIGLLGLSLTVLREDASRRLMIVHGVVAVLAVTSLLQFSLGLYPPDGPWRLLLNTQQSDGAWPGRMSVATACALICFSAAGGLLPWRRT